MATGEESVRDEAASQGPEGLLFTGGAIRRLSPDQLAAIGEFANRVFGVEMQQVRSVEQELGGVALRTIEDERQAHVPLQQKDFVRFARERGLPRDRARDAFLWVKAAAIGEWPATDVPTDLPPITLFGGIRPCDRTAIELNSLYVHLLHTFRRHGQTSTTEKQEAFLVELLNETLRPSEPLASRRPGRLGGR